MYAKLVRNLFIDSLLSDQTIQYNKLKYSLDPINTFHSILCTSAIESL